MQCRQQNSFGNVLSMQSYAGKDVKLIAVTIDHFPLCSPRILFSAFPSNISLIGAAQRMSNLQKRLLLPAENSAEILFASQTFLERMSFFYKFDYSHTNCFCNCLWLLIFVILSYLKVVIKQDKVKVKDLALYCYFSSYSVCVYFQYRGKKSF